MNSHTTLFESLQSEFCPPLDSSLVVALLSELEPESETKPLSPSSKQIQNLRRTLTKLADQADQSHLREGFSELERQTSTEETSSTLDLYDDETLSTSPASSNSLGPTQQSFSSQLGFLQATLPHVPAPRLKSALNDAKFRSEEVDMWEIIAGILTDEWVRELEERGIDALDEDAEDMSRNFEIPWETAEFRKKPGESSKVDRKKKSRTVKVPLVDIRQKQYAASLRSPRTPPAPDQWTQLSSLSDYIATLLPPHPATFFQSFLHSPKHDTPYHALRSALESICTAPSATSTNEHSAVLPTLLDILLPSYEPLNSEQRSQLISDAQLSIRATEGRSDDALDLINLLRDLASDFNSGNLAMGVYHLPPQPPITKTGPSTGTSSKQPPPPSQAKAGAYTAPSTSQKPSFFQWQTVSSRRNARNNAPHPVAQHVPAYARDVNGVKVRGSGNSLGKGGKGDVGELADLKRGVSENIRKRDEMLQMAAKMWQKGNAKTRGGEIALYYADEGRRFQELARAEALDAARVMVQSKRLASRDPDTLDLHGTTVAEAIAIVQETLQSQDATPNKPLTIITGRGSHSVNQTSVLQPAVKTALIKEDWIVSSWDGGLVVRGKRGPLA